MAHQEPGAPIPHLSKLVENEVVLPPREYATTTLVSARDKVQISIRADGRIPPSTAEALGGGGGVLPGLQLLLTNDRIQITANLAAEIPTYVTVDDECLCVSWQLSDFWALPHVRLEKDVADAYLRGERAYQARTILANVMLVPERSTCTFDGHTLLIDEPESAKSFAERPLRQGIDPVSLYGKVLKDSLWSRIPRGVAPVVEFSGGYDSSTLVLAGVERSPIATIGIIFPGPAGQSQKDRREKIAKPYASRIRDFPLSPPHTGFLDHWFDASSKIDPTGELYWELTQRALRQVDASLPIAVVTGIGGDEVMTLQADDPGGTFTKDVGGGLGRPKARLIESALLSANLRAPVYLQAGIWPVNPYLDVGLNALLERMRYELKSRRHLQRDFVCSTTGLQEEDFLRRAPENFGFIIRNELARLAPTLKQLASPLLVEQGLVHEDVWRLAQTTNWTQCSRQTLNSAINLFSLEALAQRLRFAHDAAVQ